MPTILDALVVQFKLGATPLNSQSGAVGRKLKDLEGAAGKTSGSVKKLGSTSKEAASGVETLAAGVGKLLAMVGGAYAIKAFVQDMITSSAALDRLSKNLNVSAGEITAWGNAAEQLGGSARGVQSAMTMLSKAQTEIQLTGSNALIPYFNMLGVSLADVNGHALKSTDILMQLAGAAEGKDRRTMANVFASMGFTDDTVNLLLMGREQLELTLKRQKEYAAEAAKFAPEATKMQKALVGIKQQFELLGLSLLQKAAPSIEKVLSLLSRFGDWTKHNMEFITDLAKVLGAIAIGFGLIEIAASPITLVVAAIGALALAIAGLWQDYQTWKRGGDSLIDWEKWRPGIDAARGAIKDLAKTVKESFGAIYNDVGAVEKLFKGDWKGALSSARKSDNHVRNAVKAAGIAVGTVIKGVPAERKSFAQSNGQSVSSAYAMRYFMDRGMSAAEAAGLASQIHSESAGRANAVGDHGAAYGLIQWHADRQAAFKKMFGHDIQQSTVDEQLAFMVHELQTTERSAGMKLKGATSAEQAGEIASRYYVRPADVNGEAARRGAYAQMLAGIPGASNTVAQAGTPTGGSTSITDDHSMTINGPVNIQTQATDAAGIAQGLRNGLDTLKVAPAAAGLY